MKFGKSQYLNTSLNSNSHAHQNKVARKHNKLKVEHWQPNYIQFPTTANTTQKSPTKKTVNLNV